MDTMLLKLKYRERKIARPRGKGSSVGTSKQKGKALRPRRNHFVPLPIDFAYLWFK